MDNNEIEAQMQELTPVPPAPIGERIGWHAHWKVEKFQGDSTDPKDLYEVLEGDGNLLVIGGASALWNRLTEGTPSVAAFDDTNAHLGVGDGTTATLEAMTDLQGSNKYREGAEVTHTDNATASDAKNVQFVATFATGNANFAWNEWAVFNASSGGRMLNRKVESLGTKTSAATWQLTVTLTLGGGG